MISDNNKHITSMYPEVTTAIHEMTGSDYSVIAETLESQDAIAYIKKTQAEAAYIQKVAKTVLDILKEDFQNTDLAKAVYKMTRAPFSSTVESLNNPSLRKDTLDTAAQTAKNMFSSAQHLLAVLGANPIDSDHMNGEGVDYVNQDRD